MIKTNGAIDSPIELWQRSLEGRRQHCQVCDLPVLGLFGQDQTVTERMVIQATNRLPKFDVGWFHTRCVIDVGIGAELFEMRVQSSSQRRNGSLGGYHAAIHDWLEEVQVFDHDGRIWETTFDALRHAVRVDGGLLVPVEHDVDLLVIQPKSSSPVCGAGKAIGLKGILRQLGVFGMLDYPFALDAGLFEPSHPAADTSLVGRLKYQLFLPENAGRLVRP